MRKKCCLFIMCAVLSFIGLCGCATDEKNDTYSSETVGETIEPEGEELPNDEYYIYVNEAGHYKLMMSKQSWDELNHEKMEFAKDEESLYLQRVSESIDKIVEMTSMEE